MLMKEYFSHDYQARNHQSLVKLRMNLGMEGLGIYWCIVEMLYENNGKVRLDEIETIAFELRTDSERIGDVLKKFGLFLFRSDYFYSESVNKRLRLRDEKSDKAKESALKRWNTPDKGDANALRTDSDGNAIKVNKSKVNNTNTWKGDFNIYLAECKKAYTDFLNDKELMAEQERLNPGVNVRLSLEKGYKNYWYTEAGWKNKKKAKPADPGWKRTFINSISNPMNKTYKSKSDQSSTKGEAAI